MASTSKKGEYDGENYVPEEYRHEELNDFKFHGNAKMHFKDSLESIDLDLDHFRAKMKIHPLKLKNFKGRIHYEKEHLVLEDFSGKIGHSDLKTNLHYYLGEDESVKKRDNLFSFQSKFLDIDELINYNPLPSEEPSENHDSIFNIYELPFTNMSFAIDIKEVNYHQHTLKGAWFQHVQFSPGLRHTGVCKKRDTNQNQIKWKIKNTK